MPEVKLSQGQVHYRDEGTGAPVVLVHGLLVNGTVWDRLVPSLAPHVRCIVPDLPLGSHRRAMDPGAELSPEGVARLVAELIQRLNLNGVTLVGNDTGGAICQLVVASHPERVSRLVLTNCDAFDQFPPAKLRGAVGALGRTGVVAALGWLSRLRAVRRLALSVAPLTLQPVPDDLVRGWVAPLGDSGVRRDLAKFCREVRPEATQAAAERFAEFGGDVLVAWGLRDRFFELALGERLAAAFPRGRLERIENARTFVQIDAPDELARLILKEV
jgi:pimeloyl-ACP methyl ester carboxylesterase